MLRGRCGEEGNASVWIECTVYSAEAEVMTLGYRRAGWIKIICVLIVI